MAEFQYLDKRDGNGLLLTYSAYGLAHDVSLRSFKKIQEYSVYNKLVETLPDKYVEIYFKRLFYHSFLPIAHKIVLYDWHMKNCIKPPTEKINIDSFPSIELLQFVWPTDLIQFASKPGSHKLKTNLNNCIRSFYRKGLRWERILRSKLFTQSQSKYILSSKEKNVVAVNYIEGVNKNKRSDLFWLNNSGIKPSSTLVYFESKKMMTHHDYTDKEINRLKEYGVHWIKLWNWHSFKKVEFIDSLRKKIKKNKPCDPIEKWLSRASHLLLDEVEYWYLFFNEFNVRIHLDPKVGFFNSIVKQIALTKLGGCSIGKIRSYICNYKGAVFACYANNSFFAMGQDSLSKLSNTENMIDNILVSGYPFSYLSKGNKIEVSMIEDKLHSHGANFIILLLDSNHSSNKGLTQSIETSSLEAFYQLFLSWLIDDEEIGLIIKSKKPVVLDTLPVINGLLHEAVNTGRCHVVENPYQVIPANYASIADMAIATGSFFSSALLECVSTGAKGIFYDYPNLRLIETEYYEWGENKVIFSDISEMMLELKAYKTASGRNSDLGDWSNHIEAIDPFRDGHGGERIGTYMRWLQKGFEEGLERDATIARANQKYADAWGEDKLYYREGVKAK